MLTNNGRDQLLDAMFNADTTGFPAGDPYIQLHSGDHANDAATNIVNVARVQAAFGAAASGTLSNSAIIDFASMPTVATPGVLGWSAWDVADATPTTPAGNAYAWGLFMGGTPLEGYADVDGTDATNNDLQSAAHGLAADDRIAFLAVPGAPGGSPGGPGLWGTGSGVLYYVIATGLGADSFRVSTSSGGAALDITGDGTLRWIRVVGKPTTSGDTFRIAAGDLDVFLEA